MVEKGEFLWWHAFCRPGMNITLKQKVAQSATSNSNWKYLAQMNMSKLHQNYVKIASKLSASKFVNILS